MADGLGGAFAGEEGVGVACCVDGIALPTFVLLACVPIVMMAVKHTITMSDKVVAYSTAVGPSSDARKRRMPENGCMFLSCELGEAVVLPT